MMRPTPRILAIDDEPDNLFTLGSALAPEFDLRVAVRGDQGLRLAAQEPPDLILIDVMMPEMDGFEVCRRLKAMPTLVDVPVVFITALGEFEHEISGLKLGAVDYLTKPISVELARQRIRNILERERLRKEVEASLRRLEASADEHIQAIVAARQATDATEREKRKQLSALSRDLHAPVGAMLEAISLAMPRVGDATALDQLRQAMRAGQQLRAQIDGLIDAADR